MRATAMMRLLSGSFTERKSCPFAAREDGLRRARHDRALLGVGLEPLLGERVVGDDVRRASVRGGTRRTGPS